MANLASNVLVVEADWDKLSPFIHKTIMKGQEIPTGGYLVEEHYEKGEMIQKSERFSEEGLPKVWNSVCKGIEVDWRALAEIAEARNDGIRIFYTSRIDLAKFYDGDAIVVEFESAWSAPQVLIDWLREKDLAFHLCCVEDGNDVQEEEGNCDYGLRIIERHDEDEEDSTYVYHDIDFTEELITALKKGENGLLEECDKEDK